MRIRLAVTLLLISSCGANEVRCCPEVSVPERPRRFDRRDSPAVLVGAGDVGDCGACMQSTAALIENTPGTVFLAGDGAYPDGSVQDYTLCYEPTWGRFKSRTRPAPGNHDYGTKEAAGYFQYFGAAAGTPGEGWYSFDLGDWHVVVLNSNCGHVGCDADSPQLRWLEADLAASAAECTAAIFHHARYSSGKHGGTEKVASFWEVLYRYGAEIVINGHDHSYERLAPMTPDGERDPRHGLREFVIGTGGAGYHDWSSPPLATTEVRQNDTFGVLRIDLRPDGYDWEFVPVNADGFRDSGSGTCHGKRIRDLPEPR